MFEGIVLHRQGCVFIVNILDFIVYTLDAVVQDTVIQRFACTFEGYGSSVAVPETGQGLEVGSQVRFKLVHTVRSERDRSPARILE